ncbi:MAG: MmgE/PrpD family protein [Deltaproteobacteria bacterium]|nr:MmgE/PrpD family protein [Deltaproteobacteria bacterium]
MDVVVEFAENAERMGFEGIPPEAREMTKRFILDTLGTTLAGSSAPGVQAVVDLVGHWGGKEEATVLVFGGKVPAPQAALANSVMAHARDFDDTHDGAVVHANVAVLPSALACAEARGGVSGRTLITAVALGVDLTCRLGLAVGKGSDFSIQPPGFVRTSVCGIFGAALACGKILGLEVEGLRNALGIALSQAGGTRQVVADLSLTKRMQPAFAAMAGTLSAFLAKGGITGAKEVLEGKFGFFNLYWNGAYSRGDLLNHLGQRFEGENLSFKPYPCCRYTHGSIEATLRIVSHHSIKPSDVSEVLVHVPTLKFFDLVSRPFEIRGDPQVDAQFSIPYTTAAAILRRRVFLNDFEEAAIRDPEVKRLSEKVKVLQDLNPESRDSLGPVIVEIQTLDGKIYREEVEKFKGSPGHPLTMEECQEKFRECARFSVRPIKGAQLTALMDVVGNLEEVKDVRELTSLLA